MRLFILFSKPHPQLVGDQTTSIPYKTTGMKGLANEPCYCGTVGNKIDPCRKLFSHAGSKRKLFSHAGSKREAFCGRAQ